MICRKCNGLGNLLIRKEYCYCNECFITMINHKFRACIGKNKTLSANEKVLICLSGDASSTVLLDLIHTGISLNSHKKLRVIPYFLHIIENESDDGKLKLIIEQCKNYNFDITVVNINDHNQHPKLSRNILSNVPTSISQDLLSKIKQNIFVKKAKELNCRTVFTAETTTLLATKLLSNIAIGRGSQIENDVGFADKRNEDVKVLRPMRDISIEEIDQYIRIKDLKPVYDMHDNVHETSLQAVIKNFVMDLQENYPATISTVCKTADKIGSVNNNNINIKKCVMCQSNLDCNKPNLTAVDATMFSRKVSLRGVTNCEMENIQHFEEENDLMFPFIYQTLCYCCSRNVSQVNDPMLHNLVSKSN